MWLVTAPVLVYESTVRRVGVILTVYLMNSGLGFR
jgi:hypothetical protein